MNKFVKNGILKDDVIKEYLQSINGLLCLPKKELALLSELVYLDTVYVKKKDIPKNITNTENRKYLLKRLGMTRDNLSTYLKRLRQKGLLMKDGPDKIFVRPELKPVIIRDTVQITLIFKIKND